MPVIAQKTIVSGAISFLTLTRESMPAFMCMLAFMRLSIHTFYAQGKRIRRRNTAEEAAFASRLLFGKAGPQSPPNDVFADKGVTSDVREFAYPPPKKKGARLFVLTHADITVDEHGRGWWLRRDDMC